MECALTFPLLDVSTMSALGHILLRSAQLNAITTSSLLSNSSIEQISEVRARSCLLFLDERVRAWCGWSRWFWYLRLAGFCVIMILAPVEVLSLG
jgi:hypothetical protein